ncbi:MAG: hypothetical protein HZB09_02785 [Candidatus Yonathbacteria bacterium]|nr:hypothetical protein [Candidatus Yonathbacteria bacterium]
MSDNTRGVDTLVVSSAELELFRLSHNQVPDSIDWGAIKAFRGILAKMCDDVNYAQVQNFLTEVLSEFHEKHPCRRRMDNDLTPKGILDELDWLINRRSPIRCRAERLYGFCHFFSKHISAKGSTVSPVLQVTTVA